MGVSRDEWRGLAEAIGGEVVEEPAPVTFNARFHGVRPRAVVRCTSAEDVVAALAFVRRHEFPFVVRSGGHCFAGHSSTDGVVVDVGPMDEVRLDGDGDGDLVTVGAGARLGVVYDRLGRDGRAIPAGTCPTVGIAGLALAGGLGILGRRYGLTSDRMVSAEIVVADPDGRVVVCDAEREPDLFWALRGAGAGNLGVVTSFVFRTVPAPRVVDFHLAWPFDVAARVVEAWQGWAPFAPDELAASLKLITTDESGDSAAPTVNVYGALQVSESETESEVDRSPVVDEIVQRVGVDPVWRWVEEMPFAEARRFWSQLPPPGTAFRNLDPAAGEGHHPWLIAKSEFFRRPLPADTVAALLEGFVAGRLPGEERELDFMPWGGAHNRVADDETAFVHRHELFQLKHSATVDPAAPPAAKDAAQAFVRRSWSIVHPYGSGGVFPAFPDPDLHLDAATEAYHGTNLPRLRHIKSRYDPSNLFQVPGAQGIAP